MGLLANFRIRTKVFVALLPLAVMVIVAAIYSSIEIRNIDTRYSSLLDRDVKVLQNLTEARALNNQFSLLLYKEIAETNVDRMRVIDGELDQVDAEFHSSVEEAKRENPSLAPQIQLGTDFFDLAVSDSRPVRAATMIQDNDKAMRIMRESTDPEMTRAQKAFIGLGEELHTKVDQQSDQLTAKTHRTILITWIVILLGLAVSFIIALSIVQIEVVKVESDQGN